ncbi:DUF4842 domain-containing protein [Vibrio lentus]|nr:DUF4842 domain-containing protein [Vibrio lentus]
MKVSIMVIASLALRVKHLEIHTADFPPTTRGTLVSDFYGIAQDDSDPSSNKYYRTTQNMPWGILISSPWNHPAEYIDITAGVS